MADMGLYLAIRESGASWRTRANDACAPLLIEARRSRSGNMRWVPTFGLSRQRRAPWRSSISVPLACVVLVSGICSCHCRRWHARAGECGQRHGSATAAVGGTLLHVVGDPRRRGAGLAEKQRVWKIAPRHCSSMASIVALSLSICSIRWPSSAARDSAICLNCEVATEPDVLKPSDSPISPMPKPSSVPCRTKLAFAECLLYIADSRTACG